MPELGWTRGLSAVDDLPAWDLDPGPSCYVERWGHGSYAAYHGDVRIGEPGTYGTRDGAQDAAGAAYRAGAQEEKPRGFRMQVTGTHETYYSDHLYDC